MRDALYMAITKRDLVAVIMTVANGGSYGVIAFTHLPACRLRFRKTLPIFVKASNSCITKDAILRQVGVFTEPT
jgi:hypothetical protein